MRGSGNAEDFLEIIRKTEPFECGSDIAKAHFAFDEGYTFLNHGLCSACLMDTW